MSDQMWRVPRWTRTDAEVRRERLGYLAAGCFSILLILWLSTSGRLDDDDVFRDRSPERVHGYEETAP